MSRRSLYYKTALVSPGRLLRDLAHCQTIQLYDMIRLLAVDRQHDTERSVCQRFDHQQ